MRVAIRQYTTTLRDLCNTMKRVLIGAYLSLSSRTIRGLCSNNRIICLLYEMYAQLLLEFRKHTQKGVIIKLYYCRPLQNLKSLPVFFDGDTHEKSGSNTRRSALSQRGVREREREREK